MTQHCILMQERAYAQHLASRYRYEQYLEILKVTKGFFGLLGDHVDCEIRRNLATRCQDIAARRSLDARANYQQLTKVGSTRRP